jgi:transposase
MIKKLIRCFWQISAPVRRPVIHKFDRHAMHLLHRHAMHLLHPLPLPPAIPADLELVLNSMVRELARLQAQVEALQQQINDMQSMGQDAARTERLSGNAGLA